MIFGGVVAVALLADLLLFHRKPHEIGLREALIESAAWITLALAFNAWISFSLGREAALQFFTGYVVEKSMSIDNIFVFILIFDSLHIPARSQHKVLYYGVAGALILRAIFVLAGVKLLAHFHAVLYLFGTILLVTGVRILLPGTRQVRPERNWLVRLLRLVMPVADDFTSPNFFLKQDGNWSATPLFIALVAAEATDIIFAVDSVPAVLAITRDSFIAFSSNAFAILGLRALYFALAGVLPRLRYLHQGLAAIILFVAFKMLAADWVQISTTASLALIAAIITLTVIASLVPLSKAERISE
jgi:tellurite resistance protein TerC